MNTSPPSRGARVARCLALVFLGSALAATALANDPPTVTGGAVTPSRVPYLGGNVTVTAFVSDDLGLLNDVFVEVRNGTSYFETFMSGGGNNDYSGYIELPPNFTDAPVNWQCYVVARDGDLQETRALAGTVTVDPQPETDEAPTLFDPEVTPRRLTSAGGPVTLEVSATDTFGVVQAYAVITGPSGSSVEILDSVDEDRYAGVFQVPANDGTTPVTYQVDMFALDGRSQPGEVDGGTITVAPAAKLGQLRAGPRTVLFGRVKIGAKSARVIVVRNTGKRGTPPVSGTIASPAAPFALAGGKNISFTLRPGQVKAYVVEFKPTAAGQQTANVTIQPAGRGQPPITVKLMGKGFAPR